MSAERLQQTRRLFEEFATLEYLLLGDLRAALDDPPEDTSRTWLVAVLDALLDALPREMELCTAIDALGRDGMLPGAADVSTTLDQIRTGHGELLLRLQTLRIRTEAAAGTLLEDELRVQLAAWVDCVHDHSRRHAELRAWLQPPEEKPPRRRRRPL